MITPRNIERLKTITFVLPMGGEQYLPLYADSDPSVKYVSRTITSTRKMTRSTSFPWNEDANVLRPLSNGVYMQNNSLQEVVGSATADIGEPESGNEDIPGVTEEEVIV